MKNKMKYLSAIEMSNNHRPLTKDDYHIGDSIWVYVKCYDKGAYGNCHLSGRVVSLGNKLALYVEWACGVGDRLMLDTIIKLTYSEANGGLVVLGHGS